MKVLQINVAVNTGSTGKIAERIGLVLLANNERSIIAFGRESQPSKSETIQIGTKLDYQLHGVKTRLLDQHAFGSKGPTEKLIKQIELINPDIVHLHNLHGYYIHISVLFNYLKKANKPVVWTMHDCWPFTGHCSFFERVKCEKWKTQCQRCPLSKRYPESWFIDNSFNNYNLKKGLFNSIENMMLVTPSHWLRNLLIASFLKSYPAQVIHNGVNLEKFRPNENGIAAYKNKIGATNRNIILGIASIWDRRKGFNDFLQLAAILPTTDIIVLVGLTAEMMKGLPANIIGIPRTESVDELVTLYNSALVFMNPTWVDNFPTTNLEALACGTPVITYQTGGSTEAIDEATGFVVNQGAIDGLKAAVETVKTIGKITYAAACRQRAVSLFNEQERFADYYQLYKSMLDKSTNLKLQTTA